MTPTEQTYQAARDRALLDDVQELRDAGYPVEKAALRLGVTVADIENARARLDVDRGEAA